MEIKLLCIQCKGHYLCMRSNTKMYGPIVETICPNCRQKITRNVGAFLEEQTLHISERLSKASVMLALSTAMESLIGNEEAYKKKKK